MKRCFKWLINWFTRWVSKMRKEEKIGFAISGLIAPIVAISLFVSIDKVPATTFDYEQMEKQVIAIQQNHDLLFKTDCNIYINNEVITVNLKNDECQLSVQFNQNFEVLSTSRIDNYICWLFALAIALNVGIVIYCIGFFIVTVIIFLLEILWESIYKKFKGLKTNSKKR